MDGADPDRWSAVAADWARLWGTLAEPVWNLMANSTGLGPGARILDVGCGTGDLLAHFAPLGATLAGIDPAPGMVARSRGRLPAADLRRGTADRLPWPDRHFDLVASVNALQFAADTRTALAELVRVTVPGGHVAISNWAEADRNDLDTIEDAVSRAFGEQPLPGGELRRPGGLDALFQDAGLTVIASGLVDVPWHAPDDDTLAHAILLGESPATVAARAATVIAAAQPFRAPTGGYHLVNAFRYAVGRRPHFEDRT
jgi:SAM-dependent methyltransferase